MVEHQATQHKVEESVGKRQALAAQIMRNELHALPPGLATRSSHHPITEVQRGDTRSSGRETDRVPASTAAQIRDGEVTHVSEERS